MPQLTLFGHAFLNDGQRALFTVSEIQSEFRLPLLFVRTMALKATVRENGPDVPIEIDFLLGH